MAKPDLNKLKAEIDSRKKDRGINSAIPAKDEFLNGLLSSLQTGRTNAATEVIKLVENKVAEKSGEKTIHNISTQQQQNHVEQQRYPANKTIVNEADSEDRDMLLWAEIDRKKKQTLAEQMQGFTGSQHQHSNTQQMPLNEGYLVENVKKIVNNYLVENFGPVVEEAIKSTILEMYAVERIKEVLTENKEMIQHIVYDTIRQLQAKNKAKAQ